MQELEDYAIKTLLKEVTSPAAVYVLTVALCELNDTIVTNPDRLTHEYGAQLQKTISRLNEG